MALVAAQVEQHRLEAGVARDQGAALPVLEVAVSEPGAHGAGHVGVQQDRVEVVA